MGGGGAELDLRCPLSPHVWPPQPRSWSHLVDIISPQPPASRVWYPGAEGLGGGERLMEGEGGGLGLS